MTKKTSKAAKKTKVADLQAGAKGKKGKGGFSWGMNQTVAAPEYTRPGTTVIDWSGPGDKVMTGGG